VIDVRPLSARDNDAYDAFVRGHPAGLVYYSTAYRDLLASHLDCEHEYLIAWEDEDVAGVLPVMWTESRGRRVCNSLPYYGSHGMPLAASGAADAALHDRWAGLVTEAAAATGVENPLAPIEREVPHNAHDERISQMTDLPAGGEDPRAAVLEIIDGSARRNVRKAEREGYTLENGADGIEDRLAALYELHRDNMAAIGGLAKSPSLFESLPQHFKAGDDFDVYAARRGGSIVAALLLFRFADTVEYFTPAVHHDHRSGQPLALILVQALAEAAGAGYRRWNWGGTWGSQDGVYRFKKKWGATDRRYRYFVQLNDRRLLGETPESLRADFGHFYVAPFSMLTPEGASPSPA
jgi:CelD/BcsL family acetyltransferase involved in cellulose biosynthesis